MNGGALIDRVRVLLKDVETPTEQGQFWEDEEILLALNASQDILLNHVLAAKHSDLLLGLISSSAFVGTGASVPTDLPDYVHYMMGMVGDAADALQLSRIYLGGEGYTYQHVKHNAVIIVGDTIYFMKDGEDSRGRVWYYKYPAVIIDDDFDDGFPRDIYMDVICRHASVLLGMKETQTQRDFKNLKRMVEELGGYSKAMQIYLHDYDKTVKSKTSQEIAPAERGER